MTRDELEEQIHDYVDGDLDADAHAAFEQAMASDDALREEVEAIRSLIAQARALPQSMTPPHDLWPDLHRRVESGESMCRHGYDKHRFFFQPATWAAAVLLIIAGSAMFSMVSSNVMPDLSMSQVFHIIYGGEEKMPDTVIASFQIQESEYLAMGQELRMAVEEQKKSLDPELLAKIEENLNIIDSAIEEMRTELARHPEDEVLAQRILEMYDRQVALLRKARSISNAS